MIKNPFEMYTIQFLDWDNTLIGVLHLSTAIEDARYFVNFFVAVNFIHPDLSGGPVRDPWAEERREKRARAKRDWPRNRVYPEESWYLGMGKNGVEIKHELRYQPAEYKKSKHRQSFRPVRMRVKEG